ncbi:hypothetical protein [Mycobacterium sp. NPDC006124]|uniref:hypothetical protein n=1 Tax=Mycobacterium sp. NPDC006124 TaxID=3156729 RepID=UPI0033B781B2
MSRSEWIAELERWLTTEEGEAVRSRVHLRPAMLMRVAEVLAAHADHGSGRHCAVTNAAAAAAAGCSPRTVTTVRRLLAEAGFAVEIRRGTGSALAPIDLRKPSVWHLVSRKKPVDNPRVCDLPPSRRDRRVSPVGKTSPSTRTRAPQSQKSSTRPPRRARRCALRPLHVQRLADELVGNEYGRRGLCAGLGRGHIGHVCDALTRSGLDLEAWTADQITAALNADMRQRGWSWPNLIENPGAFLASRLRRLPERPVVTRRQQLAAPRPEVEAVVPASAAARAAARAYFQQNRGRSAETNRRNAADGVKWFTTKKPARRARQVTQSPRGTA